MNKMIGRKVLVLITAVLSLALFSFVTGTVVPGITTTAFALDNGPFAYTVETHVPATMRDGTILYADIYRPTTEGTYPVILMRLPYNKATAQTYVRRMRITG